MKILLAKLTRTIAALISIALLLTMMMASPVSALSSGSELVRPHQLENSRQDSALAQGATSPVKLLLPAIDKSWGVGLFIPLSGEYAAIAQRFQRGVELALNCEAGKNHKWYLILVDSAKISPEDALKHFKDNHATIILGPIQSKLAQVTAVKAIEFQLPIILWAPQPELVNLGDNIFQHFLSAANQAREIARLVQRRGEKKVALLHPESAFGNDFKKSFLQAFPSQKAVVVKVGSYDPVATDFSRVIKDLQLNSSDIGTQEVPEYPFKALVIADFYPRLRLLVPQLSFNNLDQCQLYGVCGGNGCRLEKVAGRSLEGAIFLDLALNLPQPPPISITYRRLFLKTYQEEPSIYDAYAYDTIAILNSARDLISKNQASGLSCALLKLSRLNLVTGLTQVSESGEFLKQLCPIIFKNKHAISMVNR